MNNTIENVGATEFDLPNNEAPQDYNTIRYGNQYVPTPCNHKAEITYKEEVMRQVLYAK